jgi:tetratricopeptide (TPR) repeat protein
VGGESSPADGVVEDPDATRTSARRRSAAEATELVAGETVGRFVVRERVGAGGMGVVYAAFDPELARTVALKLMLDERVGTVRRARLLREAQAMAQLTHPNVVTVHDVGTYRDRVWIAMEFVDGGSLAAWLRERRRPWTEVLEVLVAAGRGLAAAHRAGLVHRDFKPDNVMLARDPSDATAIGRVLVTDFGLARTDVAGSAEPADDDDAPSSGRPSPSSRLTHTGALVGTPAYMAPEQVKGGQPDARADQFAFCVSAWEALFRSRPFGADSVAATMTRIAEGALEPPPPGSTAPAWLRRALVRGLAVDPAARWPEMDALLATLANGRTRARRKRIAVALAIVGVVGASAIGVQRYRRHAALTECARAADDVAALWPGTHGEQREAISTAMRAADPQGAEPTLARVGDRLDAWTARWRDASEMACTNGVTGGWDPATGELARACLRERQWTLEQLVAVLSAADATTVMRAVQAAAALPPPEVCHDTRVLAARLPPPDDEDARTELDAIHRELEAVRSLQQTGALAQALERAQELGTRADALGWDPVRIETNSAVGVLFSRVGRFDEAFARLSDAYFLAAKLGDARLAVGAATHLVYVRGYQQMKTDEGLHWGRLAQVELDRLTASDGQEAARLWSALGTVHHARGEYDEAKALLQRATETLESALGSDSPEVAMLLNNLAGVHFTTGGLDEARRIYQRTLELRERVLGPAHPDVALSLSNLAGVEQARGDPTTARAMLERSVAIREQALGPDHPELAASCANLGGVLEQLGELEGAEANHRRALAIRERSLGPDHPELAGSLANLAILVLKRGEIDEAEALHRRALAIRERAFGPDHQEVAISLDGLASVESARNEHASARALYRRALAIFEKALGPEHPMTATTIANVASEELSLGNLDEAERLHRRALAIRETLGADHPDVAWSLRGLARLELARGRDEQARVLQERAAAIEARAHVRPTSGP